MHYDGQPTGTLTIPQAIEAIQTRTGVRIAIATLYRLIQKGARGQRLECVRVAGRVYIRTAAIDAYLAACNAPAALSTTASAPRPPGEATSRDSRRCPQRQEQINRNNDELRRRLGGHPRVSRSRPRRRDAR
jgi:hypothetical protein